MKKFCCLLLTIISLALLAGCASSTPDSFKAYRGLPAVTIFNGAEMNLAKGQYGAAVKGFEALDAIYPFGPYAQQGQLDIIYAYYKNGNQPEALAAADRYIRLYPQGKNVDYAYYMKGLVSFKEGFTWLQRKLGTDPAPRDLSNKKQAYYAFRRVLIEFPHSIYVANARLHMAYIRNLIARKNVMIAKFYMERKAYLAAANRASYVVEHFDGSPQVIPALAIMVKAYRHLGLGQLANYSYRVLQASYPNSPEFKHLS